MAGEFTAGFQAGGNLGQRAVENVQQQDRLQAIQQFEQEKMDVNVRQKSLAAGQAAIAEMIEAVKAAPTPELAQRIISKFTQPSISTKQGPISLAELHGRRLESLGQVGATQAILSQMQAAQAGIASPEDVGRVAGETAAAQAAAEAGTPGTQGALRTAQTGAANALRDERLRPEQPSGTAGLLQQAQGLPPGSVERQTVLAELGKKIGREVVETPEGQIIVGPPLPKVDPVRQRELQGRRQTLNMVVNELTRGSEPGAPSAEEAAAGGTGGISNLMAAIDATAGQAFGTEFFPDNRQSRQALRQMNRLLTQAIVLNPRFPVAEQNAIKALIPTPDEFFENPQASVQNIRSLRDFLQRRLEEVDQELGTTPGTPGTASQPTNIPQFEVRGGQLVPVQ